MAGLVAAGPLGPPGWHAPAGVALGALLLASFGTVGVVGVVQLGTKRTPFPAPRPRSHLVEHGVYGWIRHPLYTSVLGAGFGWALLWQNVPTLLLAALQVPFFVAKARFEERRLRRTFPAYAAYERRVKRFLPGIF